MTEPQSPSVSVAAKQCVLRYGGLFLATLLITYAFYHLGMPDLGLWLFSPLQILAIAMASFQSTHSYDAGAFRVAARASRTTLVVRYSLALAVPVIGLPLLIALGQPGSVAGGMAAFAILTVTLLAAPGVIILGTSIGVILARRYPPRDDRFPFTP